MSAAETKIDGFHAARDSLIDIAKKAGRLDKAWSSSQFIEALADKDHAKLGGIVTGVLTSWLAARIAKMALGTSAGALVAAGFIGFVVGNLLNEILPDSLKEFIGEKLGDLFGWMEENGILPNVDFLDAQTWVPRRDPLTLDLDGDGLEVLPFGGPDGVLFDHDVDGVKTSTSSTVKAGAHQGLTAQRITTPDSTGGW